VAPVASWSARSPMETMKIDNDPVKLALAAE
jgi:hypothetical protein